MLKNTLLGDRTLHNVGYTPLTEETQNNDKDEAAILLHYEDTSQPNNALRGRHTTPYPIPQLTRTIENLGIQQLNRNSENLNNFDP